jgi:hypothetical protein
MHRILIGTRYGNVTRQLCRLRVFARQVQTGTGTGTRSERWVLDPDPGSIPFHITLPTVTFHIPCGFSVIAWWSDS